MRPKILTLVALMGGHVIQTTGTATGSAVWVLVGGLIFGGGWAAVLLRYRFMPYGEETWR